ncbi:hypothetical protein [Phyllobacterium endophyticum]|uniref:hypothetical protein n=1 Tax=Phyllobacterium endophyticum TaxID=1149773 RepID=UPI0011C7AA4B|nr:hypothetical protein [Phyllobacterium endophyticum]TXR46616.1 hypothetical protein FVA77_24150 [Phyllobacterium endophyticum]
MEPLHILDQGEWFGYSCEARAAWIFATHLLAVSAAVYGFYLMRRFKLWGNIRFGGLAAPPMFDRRFLPFVTWAAAVAVASYSMYEATAFSREVLYVKGSTMTETGCRGFQPFEENFDLDGMTVVFQNFHQRGRDASKMIVSTPGKRDVAVNLDSKFYPNLVKFAPSVMAEYVRRLRRDGEPVPHELGTLD